MISRKTRLPPTTSTGRGRHLNYACRPDPWELAERLSLMSCMFVHVRAITRSYHSISARHVRDRSHIHLPILLCAHAGVLLLLRQVNKGRQHNLTTMQCQTPNTLNTQCWNFSCDPKGASGAMSLKEATCRAAQSCLAMAQHLGPHRASGARAQGCRVVSAPPYPQSGRKAGWGGMAEGCKDQQEDERRKGIAGIPYAPDHCVHQGKRSVKLSSSQLPRAYKSCVRCSSTVLAATASRYVRSVAACAHLPRSCISENAMP